jgi:hypothetical protein
MFSKLVKALSGNLLQFEENAENKDNGSGNIEVLCIYLSTLKNAKIST